MKTTKLITCLGAFVFSLFSFMLIAADFPTDEQITKILTTVNDGEVMEANLAAENADSKDVKKFAKEMIKDHQKNNKKTMKLSKKQKIVPESNEKSMEMLKEAESNVATLKGLKGKEFDKAYMDMMVSGHTKVLGELDKTLIPGAKNEKLKKELEKTRKTVAEHLEDAKEIQAKL